MSRLRTLGHVTLTTATALLAVAWAASAVPLQSTKPATPGAAIATSDKVAAPGEPKLIRKVNPAYPKDARDEKVEGIFEIDIVIGRDGSLKQAKVALSAPTEARRRELDVKRGTPAALEGDPRLAEAALASVRQWRWEPILKDGKPVEADARVTVAFKLS